MPAPDQPPPLTSWKDIALFMGKAVRTAQRWERDLGLPIRRRTGVRSENLVALERSDFDAWMATQLLPRSCPNAKHTSQKHSFSCPSSGLKPSATTMPGRLPILTSWKEIAQYAGKSVRTVQRWEVEFGLPVRRPNGAGRRKSSVLIHRNDLDAWVLLVSRLRQHRDERLFRKAGIL